MNAGLSSPTQIINIVQIPSKVGYCWHIFFYVVMSDLIIISYCLLQEIWLLGCFMTFGCSGSDNVIVNK